MDSNCALRIMSCAVIEAKTENVKRGIFSTYPFYCNILENTNKSNGLFFSNRTIKFFLTTAFNLRLNENQESFSLVEN